jgi:RNA polymerase sigma-70 factor (ECF subfamily)
MDQKSDEEVAKLVPENKECFVVLVKRYEDKMKRYVRRICGTNQESSEDVAQNIFIKAYVNINSLKKGQRFSDWIYRIAHNEGIDYWRKNKKHAVNVSIEENMDLFSYLANDEDIFKNIADRGDAEKMQKVLNRLPLKFREVLMLRYLEEKSYEEMSDILKKPVATIGTLISRAKKRLRDIIKNQDE